MRTSHRSLIGMLGSAAVLALLAGTAARAEDAVILDSTAPGQAPGTVIPDGQKLSLPDGSSATLIFRSGQMLKLRGPFSGALTADAGAAGSGLADRLRMQGVDVSVVGGSRALGPSARRALDGSDLRIDPQRTSTYCIGPRDTLWLRRPAKGGELGLRRNGSIRTVAWPQGVLQIPWPDDVMVENGDQISFVDASGKSYGEARFRRVDTLPRDEAAWAAEMALTGCADQAQAALRELARGVLTPEIYLATDHGRQGRYAAGAPVRLTVEANLDGQLYCFARTAGNGTLAIFPGPARGARIDGHVPLTISGDSPGLDLHAGGLDGVREVQCYFADRDIASELPAPLLDGSLAPLPADLAADLATVFRAVPMTRIATATVKIQTE